MDTTNRSAIIEHFFNGLYKRSRCERSNLYVDGELVRFEGMTDQNTTRRNAEECIAREAVKYLKTRVERLIEYFEMPFDNIFVYMDGARVDNKESRTCNTDVDVGLIREIFKENCQRESYLVVQLEYGKSELQMYLQRDVTTNRNVFLTKDSDMLSILYGHRPRLNVPIDIGDVLIRTREYDTENDHGKDALRKNRRITDLNDDYKDGIEVYDSCVWAECDTNVTPMRLIGFDDTKNRLRFSKLVFSAFCAMHGTDFNDSLLTTTMVNGFFACIRDDELKRVNSYRLDVVDCSDRDADTARDQVFEIVVLLLLSGLRNRGVIKKHNKTYESNKLRNLDHLKDDFYDIVRTYYMYITYGVMLPIRIPTLKNIAHNCIKTIVHLCRDGVRANYENPTVFASVYRWSLKTSLNECIRNCNAYRKLSRDQYSDPKIIIAKRKLNFVDDDVNGNFDDSKRQANNNDTDKSDFDELSKNTIDTNNVKKLRPFLYERGGCSITSPLTTTESLLNDAVLKDFFY